MRYSLFSDGLRAICFAGIRCSSVHYLVKPVDGTRFAEAVCRTRDLVDSELKSEMAQWLLKILDGRSDRYASQLTVHNG
jgi:hypothetical protein